MPINANKRNNANSGRKAHNDNRYRRIGHFAGWKVSSMFLWVKLQAV